MAGKRIPDLDFLRGLAILGVLFRHSAWYNNFARAGWAGVDLFFVLSGFLVSGLLFSEFKKYGRVRIGRFLIRRGFKIYPTFYVFLITAFLFNAWINGHTFPMKDMLAEVLFLQNYFQGCFMHTWSLAIEEHFYLLLSLFVFLMLRAKWLDNRRLMTGLLISSILLVTLLRMHYFFVHRHEPYLEIYYTHLRMDGLLLGVLLSYLFHFTEGFHAFTHKHKPVLLIAGFALISPLFYVRAGSMFFNTLGFNVIHLGFAVFTAYAAKGDLTAAIGKFRRAGRLIRMISSIGIYSYSIYVWHLLLSDFIEKVLNLKTGGVLYLAVTIIAGILLSKLIEQFFLRIREKTFA
ncbi:MAG TPA: acyltransferase [Lentimicrobium sp.]|nr:acyltransferase [Lentimicrobium sp.]